MLTYCCIHWELVSASEQKDLMFNIRISNELSKYLGERTINKILREALSDAWHLSEKILLAVSHANTNSDNNCLNLRPQDVNDFWYTFIHKAVIIPKLLTREELYALWKRDLSQHDCIDFKTLLVWRQFLCLWVKSVYRKNEKDFWNSSHWVSLSHLFQLKCPFSFQIHFVLFFLLSRDGI